MNFKVHFKSIWLIILSILLTTVSSFADSRSPDRRAYVQAAYEEFHNLLFFLSCDDLFLRKLSPEERRQFSYVGEYLIKKVTFLGPGAKPGAYKTSTRVNFKLLFSDLNEEFILNPSEGPRTAKMDGDIWFNLNVINDSKKNFGLLDAFQILFHEFGHKIVEKKDQISIDSVGAKIRQHITSYFRETNISPQIKVSSITLPYISYSQNPVDYQIQPIIIVENQGQTAIAPVNVESAFLSSGIGYMGSNRSQVYTRTLMNPRFLSSSDGIRVEWQVFNRHSFVVVPLKYNYADLYTNLEKAKASEKLDPVLENKRLIQIITASEIEALGRNEINSQVVRLHGITEESVPYVSKNEESRWLLSLQEAGSNSDRVFYTAVVESKTPLSGVKLLGYQDDWSYKFSGEIQAKGNNIYELRFSLPAESSRNGEIKFTGILLNEKNKWDLPDIVKYTLKESKPKNIPRPNTIEIKNEAGNMIPVQNIKDSLMPTDQIVWSLGYNDPTVKIEQIEIHWLVPENIEKNGQSFGSRVNNVIEIIDAKDLRQRIVNGMKFVEFTSKEASKILPNGLSKEGFTTSDSFARMMRTMQITDTNYNTYATKQISIPNGWKSSFHLRPDVSTQISCEKVF